jgi:hypothetical protein
MKNTLFIVLTCLSLQFMAQELPEKIINSEVSEVTVFVEGAQIVRKKSIELPQGESILKFIDLSPFVDSQSIQVKTGGQLMILGVNHQQNYIKKSEKSEELKRLETLQREVKDKLDIENALLTVVKEDIMFLQTNKNIGGKDQTLTVTDLQQTSDFYSKRLSSLKLQELDRIKTLSKLNEQINDINNQIQTITSIKEFATGEVLVKVNAKNAGKYEISLSYLVSNVSWYPSYDIRVKDIDEPLQLIYKANVKQDTKEDWKNVKLILSSNDPNISNVAPELTPYYLGAYNNPYKYNLTNNIITGVVSDEEGPLPGVNVIVKGTTIGTETDFDGRFTITIPDQNSQLTFSYIGMMEQTRPISSNNMNVRLVADENVLEEFVITAYGSNRKNQKAEDKVSSVSSVKNKTEENLIIPTQQVENETQVYFEIDRPYTVLSNNKKTSVDVASYDIDASYQYFAIPKLNEETYLKANITKWEQYNLLAGEAQVFFEDAYVGKTLLDIRFVTDTLQISLGRDKKVSVQREKMKEFTTKQFLGSKKEETLTWKTTVKNNKNKPIVITILDQVPISNMEDIKVEVLNTTNGKQNTENGEIKWEVEIPALSKKEFELKYSVEYPKIKNIIVD